MTEIKSITALRIEASDSAQFWITKLMALNGALMFHQSGGCCDGSSPMCYKRGTFIVGAADVYLGDVLGQPFFMSASQFEYWQHTHLTIDVVNGRGSGFSIEAPHGVRFMIRSRLFTDEELAALPHTIRGNEWLRTVLK